MNSMQFLISTIFDLYLMVVILRIWLQLARADFYNPFSQFVVKATQPIVGPLRRVIPSIGRLDTAVIVLALAIVTLKVVTLSFLFAGGIPSATQLVPVVLMSFVSAVTSLIFWMLILRAILSWVSQGGNPIELVMHQLTEPLLAPIRRLIPPAGGFDWSILIAIIAIQFINLLIGDIVR